MAAHYGRINGVYLRKCVKRHVTSQDEHATEAIDDTIFA